MENEEMVGSLLAHYLHRSCNLSALEMPDFLMHRFQQATPTQVSLAPLVLSLLLALQVLALMVVEEFLKL